jgi:hypothetical protein
MGRAMRGSWELEDDLVLLSDKLQFVVLLDLLKLKRQTLGISEQVG